MVCKVRSDANGLDTTMTQPWKSLKYNGYLLFIGNVGFHDNAVVEPDDTEDEVIHYNNPSVLCTVHT